MKKYTNKNKFDIKATVIEKTFYRKIKKQSFVFTTGKGHINIIEDANTKEILISTEKSKQPISLSRSKIKQAISYLLYKRTATRKDLENFTAFNSALMGLLRIILIDIAKIHTTVKGLLRLTIKGVRFFFSGLDKPMTMDFDSIINNGGMFILNSYYYLREKGKGLENWIKKLEQFGLKLIVDSGAFTLFNAQKKGNEIVDKATFLKYKKQKRKDMRLEITVEEFADFIIKYNHLIYGYFNLDVIGDAKASETNFKKLTELTGISPIPVWHCDVDNWKESNWKELDKIVGEDYEIIALGATVELGKKAGVDNQSQVKRDLFTEVFRRHPQQNFHWLGGSSNLLFEFPFFSADSSGWLEGRKKKQIYSFESSEAATRIVPEWTEERCLGYNVNMLSSLEDMYEGLQINLDMLVTA